MKPIRLLWDSLSTFSSAYPAVLIFNLPFLLIDIADFVPFPKGFLIFIRSFFFLVLLPWSLGTTVYYFYQSTQQQTCSIRDSAQHTLSCWPRLILSSFLLVLPFVVFFATWTLTWGNPNLHYSKATFPVLFAVIGLYAFTIYMQLRIALLPCLVVLENTTVFEGLRRSWKLTKGHRKVITRIFFLGYALWGIVWGLEIPAITAVIGVVGFFLEMALNFKVRPVLMGYYLLFYMRLKALPEE